MKKMMVLLALVVLLTGVLAGCMESSEENSSISTIESTSVGSDADIHKNSDGKTTRIYTDKAGREVEIPSNPQRVVTINMVAEAIALGVKPIGAAENFLTSLEDSKKEGIESVGSVGSLDLERILELEPDLIITPVNITDETTIESLSKIAPTVVGPFYGDALENLRTMGDLLGKQEEVNTWISDYEAKAKETKEKLSGVIEEGKTALVLQLYSKDVMYIYPASTWPTVYDVLGLKLPDADELKELTSGAQLSLEKFFDYDPDYIFLTSGNDESMLELKEELTDNSVWKTLSAVKNNHVYTMGSRLSFGDVLTLDWALDEVIRAAKEVNK